MKSGRSEKMPYSLSRWTDVPAAKWVWFKIQLQQGHMMAFDQRTAIPSKWSLAPEDTLGLIFWTRDPTNLIKDVDLLAPYEKVIHLTVTGWEEVEHAAPDLQEGVKLLETTVETFGQKNVVWRFSPVPLVDDVLPRFERIATQVGRIAPGMTVYLSFLQENDRVPETRGLKVRTELTRHLNRLAGEHGLNLRVCMEDAVATSLKHLGGVCEDGQRFGAGYTDGCGCCMAVDPFTVNESCVFGCEFCYAADLETSPKKRNTTRGLPIIR